MHRAFCDHTPIKLHWLKQRAQSGKHIRPPQIATFAVSNSIVIPAQGSLGTRTSPDVPTVRPILIFNTKPLRTLTNSRPNRQIGSGKINGGVNVPGKFTIEYYFQIKLYVIKIFLNNVYYRYLIIYKNNVRRNFKVLKLYSFVQFTTQKFKENDEEIRVYCLKEL